MPQKLSIKPGDALLTIQPLDEPLRIVVGISLVTAVVYDQDDTPTVHTRRLFTTWVGTN